MLPIMAPFSLVRLSRVRLAIRIAVKGMIDLKRLLVGILPPISVFLASVRVRGRFIPFFLVRYGAA